jgi:hypothetical protein
MNTVHVVTDSGEVQAVFSSESEAFFYADVMEVQNPEKEFYVDEFFIDPDYQV